jgi:ubiquinone/menaquinone biosynthesis C-methylase UbiE
VDSHLNSHLKAWDKDYASRGRLWGGAVIDLPLLAEGSSVLELGCGDGKTLSGMPGDWKIVALDISQKALQFSRRLLPDVELVLADACRLPLQSASFDAVFAFHVTGHLLAEGRRALAREAARVLVRGGRLFFREFGTDDMRAGLGEEVESGTFRRGAGILTHYFTESEVEGIFCELELVSIDTHRWKLRIKGQDLQRSEVEAVFIKS